MDQFEGERSRRYRQYHSRTETVHEEVNVDIDPWVELQEQLNVAGFSYFYRFQLLDEGYFSTSGESLEDVIARCDRDESFRTKCVVLLPEYEQSLVQGMYLARYQVIKRPLRGLAPVALPRLFLEEQLSFRTAWAGHELGPLVHSINLGPGEERTISISTSVSRESETRRVATSALDLTESRSLDIVSEIENEARSQEERSDTYKWNVKVGGLFSFITGSASGGGTHSRSASDFARHFETLTRKAASSMSQRYRQEVTTSTTLKTSTSTTESTEVEIRNINDGCTLNLLFYQLYNRFTGGLYLDTLSFVAIPGVELISGTGILVPKTFRMSRLFHCMEYLGSQSLPVDLPAQTAGQPHPAEQIWTTFLRRILELLRDEYAESSNQHPTVRRSVKVAFPPSLYQTLRYTDDGALPSRRA